MLVQRGRKEYITPKIAAVVRVGVILGMRARRIWMSRLDLMRLSF